MKKTSLINLLSKLRKLNVQLSVDGGRLRCKVPEGVLTPALRQEIAERKAEILTFLQQVSGVSHTTLPPIQAIPRGKDLPLSWAQERLWFLNQLEGSSATYNESAAVRITGNLEIDALHKALSSIVERHSVLRTSFPTVNGTPVQVIHPEATLNLKVVDLQQLEVTDRETVLHKQAQVEAITPFDLEVAPLIRCKLLHLSATEHVLLVTMHHIVSDHWSGGVLIAEFLTLYQAYGAGEPSPLPELPIQYADFAVWQRQWLSGEVLQNQLNYWLAQLHGAPELLQLPTDRPRPSVQTYQGTTQSFTVNTELAQKLQTLSRESGTTLFMTLQAAFATLLYRYSGQSNILIGSPIANRNCSEVESLIGFFVNTLVLRNSFKDNSSFESLLAQVRETTLKAYEYQDVPFEQVVEALHPQRSLSHSPLFQVMFVLQNTPTSKLELPGVTLSQLNQQSTTAKFDLTLSIIATEQGLVGSWEYSTDLFNGSTIERMAAHFQNLLSAIVENPVASVGELPLLSAAERHQLLVEWNDTATEYPSDKCIHQLFEQQVEQTPLAVAVVFENQQLTYQQLNQRANQLAHHLQSLGVGPEVLVGICVERSIEMVMGLLGILKAGGAYVPLDSNYPQERLSYMLADAGVEVLLTQQELLESLPSHTARVVCLDTDWEETRQHSHDNLVTGVKLDNLAYVIYTSGSTGQPKGVQICHHSVVNFLNSMSQSPGLTQSDTFNAVTTISFDIAALELYLPLTVGAKVIVAPHSIATDADALLAKLVDENITVMQATPATWQMLLAAGWSSKYPLKVLCGGEALSAQLAHQILETGSELWNLYGPTEATIWSTIYQVGALNTVVKTEDAFSAIGRPIANTQIYILDSHLKPVPIGVPGELYIGGDGLARGYLNRPEITIEKFISNPFADSLSERLYKTGDLARYSSDGNIEFIGRIDNQVKIRGFRIELGEIESVLNTHPQIQQAVVIATEDIPSNKRLVAYVVTRNESLTTTQLREFLNQKLPEYMVPSVFVTLDTLPLTPNGKVDKLALPVPEREITLNHEYVAPSTQSQEIIANIFAFVLDMQNVGIHDNFFELGGHSLLATQLISRIRVALNVEIPLRAVFEFPTVAQLDKTVIQLRTTESGLSLPPIQPRIETEQIPLSWAQERLWFLNQLEGGSATYNMPGAIRVSGNLDVNALRQALSEIVRRHEVLRTSFPTVNGTPIQVIHPEATMNISVVDLQHLEATECETVLHKLAHIEATTPFDLEVAPLIRCNLLHLSTTEYVLLVTMHHIVSDGWSIGVFIQEIPSLYQAYGAGVASPLPELPIQYADFAVWQRQWLSGEVLQDQLDYWLTQLHGAPELLQLPTDRPRPSMQTYRGTTQSFTVNTELAQKLQTLSRASGTTLFMTLQAAFAALLHRYSGESDILIGSVIANRNRSEIESLIGFFVNTLVLRTRFEDNSSFESLLAQVRETTLKAYEHQDVPFEQVVEALQPERSLSHSPLFQVAFVLQNAPMGELELPGVTLSQLNQQSTTAKFDLMLFITETEQGLVGSWEYSTDLFDSSTIERMSAHFQNLCSAIVENPKQDVGELPLLSAAERQQLLVEWNDTATEYPSDKCIHQLFEQQVEQTPLAVAVVFEQQEVTYLQLNQRANQLAHHLQSLGVGPEVLVGICVERSIEMVVGLLGILKAGGAYVPLDPNYPQERLSYMLADSGVEVLLTQQSLLASLPQNQAQVVCLDTDWKEIRQHSHDNLDVRVSADNLAYVIYTSGSTGQPKGVAIEHLSLCNLAQAQTNLFDVKPTSRVLQFASVSFDASVSEIFMAVSSGAILILGMASELMPGDDLKQILHQTSVTHVTLPPSALAVLPTDELPALGQIIVAGESCPLELVNQWSVGRRFFNAYGPTESTVCATVSQLSALCEKLTIGRPISNTQIYILDYHLQPVPIGVTGELYIGGDGLARGYLNRPELTIEKFIPNPFERKSKLYKTGDLARYLPDGNIEFLGRLDNQVKIRGFRIEIGEIESVLSTHPHVQQVAVIEREDTPGNKRLVAYLVPLQAKEKDPQPQTGIELWPSVAEFYVYDELLYHAMTNDHRRNQSYQVAINQLVKDKVVVEIGTGKDAILAKFCAEAGAKKVYTIERDYETSQLASACVQKLGLSEQIQIIHGDATTVNLPEEADVCVSEIVGPIGGCEGAAVIINNARRFLKPDGMMIPQRSVTQIIAVTLPDELLNEPRFTKVSGYYTQQIFEQVGYSFDLRVCIKGLRQANWLSNQGVFEDLDFTKPVSTESTHQIKLIIKKSGRLNGFLVGLNLHTIEGECIDILKHEHCWLPVYFPVFEPGINVNEGDVIEAVCTRTLCENNLNPDYALRGCLLKKNGEHIEFEYISYHWKQLFKQTPFYQRLFADNNLEDYAINKSQPQPKVLISTELRSYLQSKLPEYMVPSTFVTLDTLPLTPNGKVDRLALPAPDGKITREHEYVAPRTAVEQTLTNIWQELLLSEKVSINDNFFEIGGDSILSIQVVHRAKNSGIQITPNQIFQNQTIAELASVVNTTVSVSAQQNIVTGVAPLTPIQHWFFAQSRQEPHHYNQSVLLHIPNATKPELLEKAVEKLLEHHDALRLRFTSQASERNQINNGKDDNIPFTVVDLSSTHSSQPQALAKIATEFQASLNLTTGPITQVVMFNLGSECDARLLIIIHHLAVDGVSWRILLSDLEIIYQQIIAQQPIQLSAKTTAFIDWAEKLNHYAQSEILKQELEYWLNQPWSGRTLLSLDYAHTQPENTVDSANTLSVQLSGEETRALLGTVNKAYNTQINDILISALALSVAQWTRNSIVLIDLEGHGREELFEDVDLSRTVGWFTSFFPVLLQLPSSDQLAAVIKSVKEQLRAIPSRGIGYGILRYLGEPSSSQQLQTIPTPEISFNYLGQFDQVQSETGWKFASESTGANQSSKQTRDHLLDINALVVEGELQIGWTYSSNVHTHATVENLAQSYIQKIRSLIEHCQSEDAFGYTPNDFSLAQLNQWSALVPIKFNGNQPPLFCIHAVRGDVLCYQHLAYYLSSEQPFYGLQAVGLNPQNRPHTSIEQMATHYIQELQAVQPHGPYFLSGWSLGGLVAFEMAQQLSCQGEQIALLALLDIYPPSIIPQQLEDDAALLVKFIQAEDVDFCLEQLRQLGAEEQLIYAVEHAKQKNLVSEDFDLAQARQLLKIYKLNFQAVLNYKPQYYSGSIVLFRASETDANLESAWNELVEHAETYVVPGHHQNMVSPPHVQTLAQHLQKSFEQAQSNQLESNAQTTQN